MSDQSDLQQGEFERGLSYRAAECGWALIVAFFSGLALWDSFERGAGWSGGPQSGFFPAQMAGILLVASIFIFFQGLRRPPGVLVTWLQLRRVAQVLIPLTFYILAIEYVGVYVASAFFIAGFMVAFGSFRWWAVLLSGLLIPLVTFWVFELQFKVPLPKGPLEAWLGY
ncbi:conserved hypothetical protein [Afipia carboxidovorans OM5]|uniref:DUF1468 domain-containing protein n=1 Tax=Afipia carboxidovorans (strain ATCC 49405 / DSM 1227 / KCTC 32145 / OM5) TaxID=504832 RepID=B6JFK4_AFIC5|nr:conserved hypothetical protein [Afipia carboxidovorans OM5]AEI02347.1 hypothetical protein OCA4_c12050 [Afipia carboxidovorans OM4]AEI05923.1 hypothetical protein OCA5_c12050 [Afipia carboxidovorans OM5]BEV46708.1 tripartite tricarboxylate transporter TctB family protein [Afipia carboxidovorans]